jgi:hypothetical protein
LVHIVLKRRIQSKLGSSAGNSKLVGEETEKCALLILSEKNNNWLYRQVPLFFFE